MVSAWKRLFVCSGSSLHSKNWMMQLFCGVNLERTPVKVRKDATGRLKHVYEGNVR